MANDQKTRRVLRLNRVNGDGRAIAEAITLVVKDPTTNEEMRNDDGSPAVTIRLRPMQDEERASIVREHTRPEKDPNGGRGLFEVVDQVAATDEILRRSVLDWNGIAGADDRPLVCTDQTKVLLDAFLRAQITRKLFGAEAVEVLAESFR